MMMSKNKYKDKALTAVNKIKANVKETYYHMKDIPSITVQELAEKIKNHPNSHITKKELLGITYTFYQLKTDDDDFYMETNKARILQLDGYSGGKQFVSYRSYRDSYELNTPIKLPTPLK
ncbi:hypothetical protein [Mesobacillus maritimus]|uniref:hypothetical protein n=1 Tax=Mesobacillus maritimus TaxID=1643336 RepID=UPI00384EF1DA